jgi:hypothetical protein
MFILQILALLTALASMIINLIVVMELLILQEKLVNYLTLTIMFIVTSQPWTAALETS